MTETTEKKDQQVIVQQSQPNFMRGFAEEVAKIVIARLPNFKKQPQKKQKEKKNKDAFNAVFLDTSAIIDGRIIDVIKLGLLQGAIVVTDGVLLELKHIADSKEQIKKDRGRRGLDGLSAIKKIKTVKVIILNEEKEFKEKHKEVDERLIFLTRQYKGRLITCDYNLEKKAGIQNVKIINVHALAQLLKVAAIPGEKLFLIISHIGKDKTQGVGYLDDGTMIVVEKGSEYVGQTILVVITRVIQTSNGKILFAKKD